MKREKSQWLRSQTENLARELKIRPESDGWLQNEIDQYDERVKVNEEQQQQLSNEYNQLGRVIDKTRDRLQRKHVEAGRYEQQQASHGQEIEDREIIIRESARRHNIHGYEADLGDVRISEFMERVSKLHKDHTRTIERVRGETEKDKQKVRDALSRLGEERSGLQEGKSSANRQSLANDQKVEPLQSDLDAIDIDEGAQAVLDSNFEEISESLRQAKEKYKTSSWDAKLNEAKVQERTIEEELEQTNQELVQATKNSKDMAQLDYLRKELKDRQRALETLRGVHNERLRSIVGEQWNVAGLERDFQSVMEQRSRSLRKSEDRRNDSAKDLEQTDFKLSSYRDDLRKAEKEHQECVTTITNAIGGDRPDAYPEELENSQSDRDKTKVDLDDFANMRNFYEKSIETAQGKGRCKLCERNFHGQSERSDFVKRMEEKIKRNTLIEMEKELKVVEEDLQKLRSVGLVYNNWLRLSKIELPRLRSEIQQLEQSKATLVRQSEHHDKEVSDLEDNKKVAESLSKPISNIARFQTDISNFTEQIKKLSRAHEDSGVSRSLDVLQEQRATFNDQAKAKRNLIQILSEEKQHAQSSISAEEVSFSNAQKELSVATYHLEKKSNLVKQIEDLRKSNRDNRNTIKRMEDQIQALSPQEDELKTKLKDIEQRGDEKNLELQRGANKLSQSLQDLRAADQRIQGYLDNEGPARLDRCHQDIKNFQDEIERTGAEQKRVITELNKVNEKLKNHNDTRRTIKENLDFRRTRRELEEVDREIDWLSEQNAEADVERLEQQASHWQAQYHKYNTDMTSKLATATAKDEQLQVLLKDWKTDYQNAAHEYKEAHIKVEASATENPHEATRADQGL